MQRTHHIVLVLACAIATRCSLCEIPPSNAAAPLTTASSVLALNEDQAKQKYPVHLQGIVVAPSGVGMIIQDGTAGIWANTPDAERFVAGDFLDIQGTVGPGGYSPEIWVSTARKIGHRNLPKPRNATYKDLSSGNLDAQYVSVVGTIRSIQLPASNASFPQVWLKLAMKDGVVDATLPDTATETVNRLLDAEVRVDAVALCAKNKNRQLTSIVLGVNNLNQIMELKPRNADPFAQPLLPLGALMQYRSGTDYYHRVRVAGVVTYYEAGKRLILQDGQQALSVVAPPTEKIELGDSIEVSGFPAPEDAGPILQDAVIRFISHGQPPEPTKTSLSDVLSGESRYRLISIEGHLVRRIDEPWGVELLVQSQSNLLQAELRGSASQSEIRNLREGTEILLSGISLVDVEGKWGYERSWVHCKLLLRSAKDVQVLRLPTWWTTRHVMYIATFFGVLILILLGLVIYNQIARWKLQVVLQERERMAHEIHDTMAQSFAGIGFQLQAVMRAIPEGMPDLQQEVSLARDLVRHSHREARRSFATIESESNEEIDLLHSLESCAQKMVIGGAIAIHTSASGTPRTLSTHLANQLLKIGQEAIANAVRHAEPHRLNICIEYTPNFIRLKLQDDGIGFMKSGNLLGFGLRGMRRRAADISARLEIVSEPGRGTQIEVTAPFTAMPHWTTWIKQLRLFRRRESSA